MERLMHSRLLLPILLFSAHCWGQVEWSIDTLMLWSKPEFVFETSEIDAVEDFASEISYRASTVAERTVIGPYQSWHWKKMEVSDNLLHPIDLQMLFNPEDSAHVFFLFRHYESSVNLNSAVLSGHYPAIENWLLDLDVILPKEPE
ncbi:hypothetical protein [Phaeocystidibacter marisrubri]|uniref:Uncharacterized protein n=1 Tax=Phaeocystidibacter marisrubri TaxID=1577780 RepID=A0A6L3ZDI8_9FLAO|nr:hypothetical protein [Phaeocystidibacter marisrubri]KAB2815913.1 hypothetical protein F8C82_09455 [Phaeocystidibacter marisrubri]